MPNRETLSQAGYTPSRKELGAVFDWLLGDDEDTAKLAERALLRSGQSAIAEAIARLASATALQRVRLLRLLGRLAQVFEEPTIGLQLLSSLDDAEPRAVRAAIVAFGKLSSGYVQSLGADVALLERLGTLHGAERRAAIETLGKIGGQPALGALERLAADGEFEAQLLSRAKLRLGRMDTNLEESDHVRLDVPLGVPTTIAVLHRRGLSEIVARQLAAVGASQADGNERRLLKDFQGSLSELFIARSMLGPAILLELGRPKTDAAWAEVVADAICSETIVGLLERLTSTRPRLRFALPEEGHQRALLWQISELIARRTDRIAVNPKAALWDVHLDRGRQLRAYLTPKRFDDPRFAYRVSEISGASHPTIAAALVDVVQVHAHDVVWDPFVGSGLELIECGLRGPYRELIGTDNNSRSLEAAAANVRAAQLDRVRLLNADARSAQLNGITAIVTNPPLGIRHHRDGQLWELLRDFLSNARRLLRPLGRMVWLSPLPVQTAQHAEQLGFVVSRRGTVDVGGLSPELQVLQLPKNARS